MACFQQSVLLALLAGLVSADPATFASKPPKLRGSANIEPDANSAEDVPGHAAQPVHFGFGVPWGHIGGPPSQNVSAAPGTGAADEPEATREDEWSSHSKTVPWGHIGGPPADPGERPSGAPKDASTELGADGSAAAAGPLVLACACSEGGCGCGNSANQSQAASSEVQLSLLNRTRQLYQLWRGNLQLWRRSRCGCGFGRCGCHSAHIGCGVRGCSAGRSHIGCGVGGCRAGHTGIRGRPWLLAEDMGAHNASLNGRNIDSLQAMGSGNISQAYFDDVPYVAVTALPARTPDEEFWNAVGSNGASVDIELPAAVEGAADDVRERGEDSDVQDVPGDVEDETSGHATAKAKLLAFWEEVGEDVGRTACGCKGNVCHCGQTLPAIP